MREDRQEERKTPKVVIRRMPMIIGRRACQEGERERSHAHARVNRQPAAPGRESQRRAMEFLVLRVKG